MAITLLETINPVGTTVVTFSNIPQTAKHIQIIWSFRQNNSSGDVVDFQINGNSSTIYDTLVMRARTTTAQGITSNSGSQASINHGTNNTTNPTDSFSGGKIIFAYYAGDKQKTFSTFANQPDNTTNDNVWGVLFGGGVANTTSAITSISMTTGANLLSPSTASIYLIS